MAKVTRRRANEPQPGKAEKAAERRVKALEFRKAGASYREIGRRLHVSTPQAFRDVHHELAALAERSQSLALEVRSLELERLDALLAALWPGCMSGDTKSVMAALAVGKRRADLLGLDAPQRFAIDWESLTEAELERLAAGEDPAIVLRTVEVPSLQAGKE